MGVHYATGYQSYNVIFIIWYYLMHGWALWAGKKLLKKFFRKAVKKKVSLANLCPKKPQKWAKLTILKVRFLSRTISQDFDFYCLWKLNMLAFKWAIFQCLIFFFHFSWFWTACIVSQKGWRSVLRYGVEVRIWCTIGKRFLKLLKGLQQRIVYKVTCARL